MFWSNPRGLIYEKKSTEIMDKEMGILGSEMTKLEDIEE